MASGLSRKDERRLRELYNRLTLTMSAKHFKNSPGESTCSNTSIEHTTSYVLPSFNNSSALVCR